MPSITVGPSGRDYTTFQAAIHAANDNPTTTGDITEIIADGGTYVESLSVTSLSGGWMVPCIIRAADPSNPPIISSNGSSQAISGSIYRGSAVGQLTLKNLVFSGWTNASNAVIYVLTEGLVIENCWFIGNTNRKVVVNLGGTSTRQARVHACKFIGSGRSGSGSNGIIMMYSAYADVTDNIAVCDTNVQFQSGAGRYIEHNSVYGTWNTGGSCKVFSGAAAYRGNLIKNAGTGGSHAIDASGGGSYTENIAGGTFGTRFAGTDGGSNQNADPLFVDGPNGDLTLSPSSPAIRSLARSANTLLDFLGVTRSDPTDAGAYEMTLSTTIASLTNTIISGDQNRLRLTLGSSWAVDPSWVTGAFAITAGGGVAIPSKVSLTPDADPASYLDLVTGLQKDAASYTLAWTGLVGIEDDSLAFTGDADSPSIVSAVLQSYDHTTRTGIWRVTFSRVMASTGLSSVTNYNVSPVGNGRRGRVTAVTLGSPLTYVDLTVRGMEPGKRYRFSMESA